jgi:hypothetical protein
VAASVKYPAYRAAVCIIAADAAPCQASPANPEVTEENDCAAEPNSVANPSHDAAATSIGAEPGPEYSNDEMISGGDVRKLIPRAVLPLYAKTTFFTGDGHLTPQVRRSGASQGR